MKAATPIATSFFQYFLIKNTTVAVAETFGSSLLSDLSTSPFMIAVITSIVMLFMASFFPKEVLLDRRFSFIMVVVFGLVLSSSRTFINHLKERCYTEQIMSAKGYCSGDYTLQEVYNLNNVRSGSDKNKFALSLIKAGSGSEKELFIDVIKDGMGTFSHPFDRQSLTYYCLLYGDEETANFLIERKLFDTNETFFYGRLSIAKLFTSRKEFTPLEIAKMQWNRGVARAIERHYPSQTTQIYFNF